MVNYAPSAHSIMYIIRRSVFVRFHQIRSSPVARVSDMEFDARAVAEYYVSHISLNALRPKQFVTGCWNPVVDTQNSAPMRLATI